MLNAGEVQWMTAGRGIIHGENVAAKGKVSVLQLWMILPKSQRWTTPGFQDIHTEAVPVRRENGVEVRLYSGASGDHHSPPRNHVPVTLAEIKMEARALFEQDVPTSHNGFVYPVGGSVRIGEDAASLKAGQVGWLDRSEGEGISMLRIVAGKEGVRLVLYALQPQGDPTVSQAGSTVRLLTPVILRRRMKLRRNCLAQFESRLKKSSNTYPKFLAIAR